jgi:hypothetical protein
LRILGAFAVKSLYRKDAKKSREVRKAKDSENRYRQEKSQKGG